MEVADPTCDRTSEEPVTTPTSDRASVKDRTYDGSASNQRLWSDVSSDRYGGLQGAEVILSRGEVFGGERRTCRRSDVRRNGP